MRKMDELTRELSEDENDPDTSLILDESDASWRKDFHGYLNSKDQLGDMSIVEWWGVSISSILLM